ncbi:hypothetical protein EYF80_058892 [Liparis tanakae]|uniref:Uncharacterized protein n=1 Tax=Liparis tanakae TaxID=230148 RepID=A0A4Z2EQ84_9TELE|nr:hypothetical protein EYF80_058892 [Liparis tanakae]
MCEFQPCYWRPLSGCDVVHGGAGVQRALLEVGALRVGVGDALEVVGGRVERAGRLRLPPRGDAALHGGQLLHVHQDGLLFLLGAAGAARLQPEVDLAL